MAANIVRTGSHLHYTAEVQGPLQDILLTSIYNLEPHFVARASDVYGCVLEFGEDRKWHGTIGSLTSTQAAALQASGALASVASGTTAIVDGVAVTWGGETVGLVDVSVSPDFSGVWTGFGDSITATNFAFSLTAIQNMGMAHVGISAGGYGIQLFGYPGKRSDEVLQYIQDIIASGAKNCIVMLGTNNANQSTSLATFYSDLVTIYQSLKRAGIRVIGSHIPPGTNKPENIFKFNHAITKAGAACGVLILSPWGAFANAITGELVSGVDITHPNPAQSSSAASICVQQIKDGVTAKILATSNVGGLVANPCFAVDSNADGLADSWNSSGTGVTFSLVAGSNGNKQRLTANISSGSSGVYQNLPTPIVGNKVKLTGKIRITSPSNVAVSVYIRFKNSGGTGIRDLLLFYAQESSDIDLFGDAEVVTPVGAVTAQLWCSIAKGSSPAVYPAVAVVDLERIQAIDLTAVGIA